MDLIDAPRKCCTNQSLERSYSDWPFRISSLFDFYGSYSLV
jgi:hypothetical protein